MRQISPEAELGALLKKFNDIGGVLDYVFLETHESGTPEQLHRLAALAGIAAIDRNLEQWAKSRASEEIPVERFFRLWWDDSQLKGEQISFSTFWGNNEVQPKRIAKDVWTISKVDGYKSTFFNPAHSLHSSETQVVQLFNEINTHIFGEYPERVEIFSWSTDWSNYFDAGLEWWGAFFWTIRSVDPMRFIVIGASTTD